MVNTNLPRICRIVLIVLNFLGLIAGLIFLGASIFLLIDKGDLVTDVLFLVLSKPACIMIIAASAVSIAITALGLIAVMANSRILLIIYAVVVVANLIVALVAAIFGIILVVSYADWIREAMRESIQQRYGADVANNTRNAFETQVWDTAQQKWYCCGVEDESWPVYRNSLWFNMQPGNKEFNRPMVPKSCCVTNQYGEVVNLQKCQTWQNGPPKLATGIRNEALFYSGCYSYGLTVLNRVARGVTAMGFLLAIIEIAITFCTVILIIHLGRKPTASYYQKTPSMTKQFSSDA